MAPYILKRLLGMIPVILGVMTISFFMIQLAPGKPTDILTELNPKMTPEARKRLEQYYGLDKPLHVQYISWLKRVARLDFGNSFAMDGRPVMEKIWDTSVPVLDRRLAITLLINIASLALILMLAAPIGIYSATHPYSAFDRASTVFVFVGFATPAFWLALLLMILFGIRLDVLPISGLKSIGYESMDALGKTLDITKHLVLPVFVSAFGGIAGISRYMRSSMLEAIRNDYITTARAKGLSEKTVIYRHALRNALLPVITILGLSIPGLISGSVIFEQIFGIQGMGQLAFHAVMTRDYPVVMGLLVITCIMTLAGNLIADIGYALADPRIRVT